MSTQPDTGDLFGRAIQYPDADYRDRLGRLVGLDEQKTRLGKMLGLLVKPRGLTEWAERFHPEAKDTLSLLLRRPPLVVLAGDVGSGKTELAETIGDLVARQEGIPVTLLPLSLASRGQGRVGEMTQLLTAAFEHAFTEASNRKDSSGRARGAIIFLVDEADALAQSREAAQMHHEDRAGVNAFIRGIDRLGGSTLPAAVIMCTNRLAALDPAIRRRAADVLTFSRPGLEQRRAVLEPVLQQVGLDEQEIGEVLAATGDVPGRPYGFTFSDLVQRFLPAVVLDAYPEGPIDAERAVAIARSLAPTPPFQDSIA